MYFVFDVDGTISFDGETISEEIQQAILLLMEAGHNVVFASARPIRDLLPILPKNFHKCRLIGGNGAFIKAREKVEAIYFEQMTTEKLLQIIRRYQLTYLADGDWDFAYTGDVAHPIYKRIHFQAAKNLRLDELRQICKLVLFDVPDEAKHMLLKLPLSVSQYVSENILDVSPLGVHKARGLRQLGIDSFIAFGNDMNDRTLFEAAQYSVCVGEGEVSKFASIVITKNQVANTIRQFANKEMNGGIEQ
ncbi:HAD-IIB family hydrolase [Metasolibacillus fluoroglycofenilyticus]|uniref:HAD-IIB family hydrolase n=1 Tax=Metasolibacillus fluoroglycofenilyticus TaxID=1239396 RepID=UPI000D3A3E77|nr:HAD family hydrolase [Metasolibacillus fluoroglycofenilyticus]